MNQQIILREDVTNLGHMGDLVSVKPGYARNFLLPRGLAVVANEKQKLPKKAASKQAPT